MGWEFSNTGWAFVYHTGRFNVFFRIQSCTRLKIVVILSGLDIKDEPVTALFIGRSADSLDRSITVEPQLADPLSILFGNHAFPRTFAK